MSALKNVIPNNNKYGSPTIERENFTTPADLRLLQGQGIRTVGALGLGGEQSVRTSGDAERVDPRSVGGDHTLLERRTALARGLQLSAQPRRFALLRA